MYANEIIDQNEKNLETRLISDMRKLVLADYDTSFLQDNLMNTYESLLNKSHKFIFSNRFFNLRKAGRKVDKIRKDNPLDFVADFVGDLEPSKQSQVLNGLQVQEILLNAQNVLNEKNYEIFQLFLIGWNGQEIADIYNVGRAAISRKLGRIIDKLNLK